MEAVILANLNFIVLVLLYKFIISKSGIPKWNRWLLLSLPVVAIVLPVIQLVPKATHHIYQVELPFAVIEQTEQQVSSGGSLSLIEWIYILGVVAYGLLHLWGFTQIYQRIKKSQLIKKVGAVSIYKSSINASFGSAIFIKKETPENEMALIIKHEIAHIHQWHTLDKIYALLIQVIVWFNPIVYVWQNLMDKNHEYLADEEVLESESLESYSLFLLQQKMQANFSLSITPVSKMSHLKSRIMKMKSKSINQYKMKNSKMKYLWFPACLLVLSVGTISANYSVEKESKNLSEVHQEIEDPDVLPQFEGGTEAMIQFLVNNIKYPETAKNKNIEGTVYVAFVVNSKGEITKPSIKRGVEKSLDNEALRVINSMPNWKPGEKDGKKVSVEMVLPISFQLPQGAE